MIEEKRRLAVFITEESKKKVRAHCAIEGISVDEFIEDLIGAHSKPSTPYRRKVMFYSWLLSQVDRDDQTGDLANDAKRTPGADVVQNNLESWLDHTRHGINEVVIDAWDEYKADRMRVAPVRAAKVSGDMFYIIQLEPDADPLRVKFGFSKDVQGRLAAHRCAAPLAKLIKCWPAKRTWEKSAIDYLSRDSEQLHTEVFRVPCLDELIESADTFFSMMPEVK